MDIQKGIRCMFWEKLGLWGACSLSDMLNRAQIYINYKEDLLAKENTYITRNPDYDLAPKKDNNLHIDDR